MKKFLKIPLAGFSFILFLIAFVLFLYFFTSVPEQQLNDWLGYYLSRSIGYKVTIESINRDIWRGLNLRGIKIFYESDAKLLPVGSIGSITATYSIRDIIFYDIHLRSLQINDLDLTMQPKQKLIAASASKPESKSSKPPGIAGIAVDKFELNRARLSIPLGSQEVEFEIPKLAGSFRNLAEMATLKIDTLSILCPQKDLEIKNFEATLSLADSAWLVENLKLQTGRSNIALLGKFGKLKSPDLNMTFKFDPLDLGEVGKVAGADLQGKFTAVGNVDGGLNKLTGELRGDGDLFGYEIRDFLTNYSLAKSNLGIADFSGTIFKSPITGSGNLNLAATPPEFTFTGNIKELNLENIGVGIYSAFSGRIDLQGAGLAENNMKMKISCQLTQADIDVYHFDRAQGTIDFDINRLHFTPGFQADYKHAIITIGGDLEYAGDIEIQGAAHFGDLSDFKNQTFISDLDGTGEARFAVTGRTEDFDFTGSFDSDSCRFFGLTADTLSLDVNLKSVISHKVGTVVGSWKGGNVYSVPVDSGYYSVVISGEKYFVDRLFWENADGSMSLAGSYDNGTIPPSLVVDSLRAVVLNDSIYNIEPLVIDLYDKEIEIDSFELHSGPGSLGLSGTITYDGQMDLTVNADGIEIEPIMKYFVADRRIQGVFSGNLLVRGDLNSPAFSTEISLVNMIVDDISLGRIDIRADYAESRLYLNPVELEGDGSLYTLTGSLPVNLSLGSDQPRFPQGQIDARLIASGNSIILMPVFVSSVESFDCGFSADVNFSGSYNDPQVDGVFAMTNGRIKLIELVNPISGINVTGRMKNNHIYIDSLAGYIVSMKNGRINEPTGKARDGSSSQGKIKRGLISGSGSIELVELGLFKYDLTFSGTDCDFSTDAYDIQGTADFKLTVTGSNPPAVGGTVQIKRLDMKEPFESFSTGAPEEAEVIEDSTMWGLKLDISATNNIWIKNPEANMELSGDVLVSEERGIYSTLGQLDVIRGDFYLFNLRFKISNGTMVFNDISNIDPDINFEVSTRITERTQGSENNYSNFDLLITGTLTNPQIKTAEGSGYSDQDILKILIESQLGGGLEKITTGSGFAQQIMENARDYLLINNPFERTGVIDEFDINPHAQDQNGGASISVAKYISPKLFLRYSQPLSFGATGQTIGFEYIFNDNLSFEGKQGTNKDEGVSFDIKLRYEY